MELIIIDAYSKNKIWEPKTEEKQKEQDQMALKSCYHKTKSRIQDPTYICKISHKIAWNMNKYSFQTPTVRPQKVIIVCKKQL